MQHSSIVKINHPSLLLRVTLALLSSIILLLFISTCIAQLAFKQPLPVDTAFAFSASVKSPHAIEVHWKIAPRYHLYRERFKFKLQDPHLTIGSYDLPPGIPKQDEILGPHQVYENQISFILPIQGDATKLTLIAQYQGCADDGFCYPPTTKQVTLDLNKTTAQTGITVSHSQMQQNTLSEQEKIIQLLQQRHFGWIILIFIGIGLLLTFTPCVLPMIPILSSIIVGQGQRLNTRRAFFLSLTYVLSMACTYAIAGIIAGLLGSSLQAALQNKWVISAFALLFVLLALSLFGFYELQLPRAFTNRINQWSHQQQGGTYFGVFMMGMLATLIVSPCLTAPLFGILAYIGNTGDSLLGGIALFSLGIGMGIPLLIIGTVGGSLLPKAGKWMNAVKSLFGVLILAMAIWLLSRIIPGNVIMLLWAALFIICAVYLGAFETKLATSWQHLWKGLGLILFIYGIILILGGALGNTDPFHPLAKIEFLNTKDNNSSHSIFMRINNRQQLAQALQQAKSANRPLMLDFYADWCVSCKIMEKTTFADPKVINALKSFVLVQADVTANNAQTQDLEHSLQVIAPPTIIFFDRQGQEIKDRRIVGEVNATQFLQQLEFVQQSLQP
ncbi:MAG: protein-disulfide reductase DsbD [Legionellales bacterium]|nr:protein-disulfide reductase DsbD [Legionellales bacterium]